jgi:hypothetical protein
MLKTILVTMDGSVFIYSEVRLGLICGKSRVLNFIEKYPYREHMYVIISRNS